MNLLKHLEERGLDPSLYPYMSVTDQVAVFPMYDFAGRMTGYQQYRPDGNKKFVNKDEGKYWSYVSSPMSVFGLESINFSWPVYLTGGLFKAATLHRLGYTALHVSAVSYKLLKPQLSLLRRPFLAVGDNDDEGRQFARRYGGFTSPVDLDEMKDEDVHKLLRRS